MFCASRVSKSILMLLQLLVRKRSERESKSENQRKRERKREYSQPCLQQDEGGIGLRNE